jgi:hypothetical protein
MEQFSDCSSLVRKKLPTFEIICLANSRKLSGRCIAGLRTDGKGWIRPVSDSPDGTLFLSDYTLKDGSEAGVLDVIRIKFTKARPDIYQPENWVISNTAWELVERPASSEYQQIFRSFIVQGSDLFCDQSDRICVKVLLEAPAKSSLALVVPDKIDWIVTKNIKGRRQVRALFNMGGAYYNLGITDPLLEQHLSKQPLGNYSVNSIGLKKNDKLLLTISLGEPFQGDCYKLVTSVLFLKGRTWCHLPVL